MSMLHYAHDLKLGAQYYIIYIMYVGYSLKYVKWVDLCMRVKAVITIYHLHLTSDIIVTLHYLILIISHIDCWLHVFLQL